MKHMSTTFCAPITTPTTLKHHLSLNKAEENKMLRGPRHRGLNQPHKEHAVVVFRHVDVAQETLDQTLHSTALTEKRKATVLIAKGRNRAEPPELAPKLLFGPLFPLDKPRR